MLGRVGVTLVVIIGCLVVSAAPGVAATQVVVDCGSGASLQSAIDAAPKGAILDISGTCVGTFTVGKKLVLKGVSNAVLDGQGAGTTLTTTGSGVRVTKLTVTGGWGVDSVGGIQNTGALTLVRVTVQANGGGHAGGIQNHGTLLVQRSVVTRNDGPEQGGGVANFGTATIEKSTISANAGGIDNRASGMLMLTDSTVSGNREASVYGAGILNAGTALVMRSTIANNKSGNAGGGGIGNAGTLTVVESTISGNVSDEVGGGIVNDGSVTLTATVLAGNTDVLGEEANDCGGGGYTSNGYNLFGTPCATARSTDLAGTFDQPLDPILKALGSYGGPTQTMVPRPASPAVNAIPVGATGADGSTAVCPSSGTADQRGIARPQAGACEIGSVERKPKE